jgi:hypothetical protein
MIAARAGLLCSIFCTSLFSAGDFSTYRGFEFGKDLAAAAKQIGVSEPRTVHQRPALIQEITWRPGSLYSREDTTKVDPLREGLLRFYNGELFQVVATYDRQKVEGMTEADMMEAISLTYGAATKPAAEIPYRSNYGEVARVLARWENAEYSANLIRTGDHTSFALILSLKRLDTLAQAAIVESTRLNALEAPHRAIDLQKRQDGDSRLLLDKARSVNVPNFRP